MNRSPVHGGDLITCQEQHGVKPYMDFSANINPMGMPEGVLRAFEESAGASIHYPDPHCRELRRALAEFESVPQSWILCGNGAADLIYRTAYALRPQNALLAAPAFAEYGQALSQAGSGIRSYTLHMEYGFLAQPDILDAIPGNQALFLCNPNNPTGALISEALLEEILYTCRRKGTVLVVDECFLDFVEGGDSKSLKKHLAQASNLIILRAFTKIFAMPGIRLGYCLCSDEGLLGRIGRAGAPWSVSVPAQLCGVAATKERDYLEKSRALVSRERRWLQGELRELGLTVYESAANFILFFTEQFQLGARLCEKGFVLRDCSNFKGLGSGYFRMAVRRREENNALLHALRESMD